MVNERGLDVHHTTIFRWVQQYAPELDKRCRSHVCLTNDSWRVDETYIKIKGKDRYLYRASIHKVSLWLCCKNNLKTDYPPRFPALYAAIPKI
jgi:transposase-like protein